MGLMVTTEELYREACAALGETIVQNRLLAAELARRDGHVIPDEVIAQADQPVTP